MAPSPSLNEIYRIASEALDVSANERSSLLDAACGEDVELRSGVEAFLAKAEASEPDSLDKFSKDHRKGLDRVLTSGGEGPGAPAIEWCPDRIGPFEIRRQLGRGGMGVVFEAVQDKPRRSVALKLMYPGTASEEASRRFLLEGEALGRLQHPGIAQIYATDTADVGFGEQPYLAMELIQGRQCLEYAHENDLDTRARVLLLAKLCDAVEHAHQRGIVHRDIKPDNVLVDESGQPKLLDFGVARVVKDTTIGTAHKTEHGRLLGTMAYMAPEQVRGDTANVGHAADIYALGALGFELLTAQLPREIAGLNVTQAIERLLATDAKRLRDVQPGASRDLDTIIGKALAARPKERYAAAAAMAADLRSHLAHRTISARPPSRIERTAKFVRRHRALAWGTAAVLLSLTAGVVGIALKAVDLRRAKVLATDNEYIAEMRTAMNTTMSRGGAADARAFAKDHTEALTPERLRGWEWNYAQSFLLNRPLIMAEDINPLGAAWSPDGARVAVAGTKSLVIYRAKDGKELDRWDVEPTGAILALAWDPEGNCVAITGVDVAAVYDTRAKEGKWVRADQSLQAPTWDLDGTGFWATHFKTHALIHFNATTGETMERLDALGTDWGVKFDPVTGASVRPGMDHKLRIYPRSGTDATAVLGSHNGTMTAVAWKPDGTAVASAAWDRIIRVWNPMSPSTSHEAMHTEYSVRHATMCLDWHPSEDLLLSAGQDGIVRVWEARRGETDADYRFQEHLTFEDHPFHVTAAGWSPDGTKIVAAVAYTDVRIWELRARMPRRSFALAETTARDTAQGLAWLPDSRRLLVRSGSRSELWDTHTMAPTMDSDLAKGMDVSPDGQRFTEAWAGSLTVGSTATMRLEFTIPIPPGPEPQSKPSGATASWRPDGELFVIDNAGLWQLADEGLERLGDGLPGQKVMAWSPDGEQLLASSFGEIHLLDPANGARLRTYQHPRKGAPIGLHVHPSKPLFAIADDRGGVDIVSLESLERVGVVDSQLIASVDWSPDGLRLATASNDGTVRIWDAETWELRASFPCEVEMRVVRWSPDGRVLAGLGLDHRVRLWDAWLGFEAYGNPH